MSQLDVKIGPKIKSFRRQLGLQANKLAEQLGISPSYLNLIESGKRKIDGDLLLKVCEELKIELSDLTNKSDLNLVNVYIGHGFLLQYFFKSITTDNLFMTLTDLNNNIIKRNSFVKNYIYFFHGAVSTTRIYTSTAFDNYDTILCNGE